MPNSPKGFAPVFILIIGLLLIVCVGGYFLVIKTQSGVQSEPQNSSQTNNKNNSSTRPDVVGFSRSSFIPERPYNYNWVTALDSEKGLWNTYTDDANLFSVQYPKEWYLAGSKSSPVLSPDKPCPTCGGFPRGVSIFVEDNKDNLSSKDYVRDKVLLTNGQPSQGFIIKDQPSYLSSIDATLVDGLPGAGNPGPVAYISKSNKIITLWSDGLDDNTLVSKIFSTFKFN